MNISDTRMFSVTQESKYGKEVEVCMDLDAQAFFDNVNATVANPS